MRKTRFYTPSMDKIKLQYTKTRILSFQDKNAKIVKKHSTKTQLIVRKCLPAPTILHFLLGLGFETSHPKFS